MERIGVSDVRESGKKGWIPRKDRIWVFLSIAISALIIAIGLWQLLQMDPAAVHQRSFERVYKNYGSNARLALFAVLAYYVFSLIIKKRWLDGWNFAKKALTTLTRLARRWHTPLAVIAIGFILLHVVAVFLYGIKLDFHNISGILALLVLLPVPVSGLFRYQRLDRKWHLRSGLAFAVLFLIHAFL